MKSLSRVSTYISPQPRRGVSKSRRSPSVRASGDTYPAKPVNACVQSKQSQIPCSVSIDDMKSAMTAFTMNRVRLPSQKSPEKLQDSVYSNVTYLVPVASQILMHSSTSLMFARLSQGFFQVLDHQRTAKFFRGWDCSEALNTADQYLHRKSSDRFHTNQ